MLTYATLLTNESYLKGVVALKHSLDAVDAALRVVLRLADVVVTDHPLRIVVGVEEGDGAAHQEGHRRHHVLGRRTGIRLRPAHDAHRREGDNSRAAQPRVDRAIDSLLDDRRHLAALDGGEHQVVDAAGKAGDEEAQNVAAGAI